MSTESPRTQSVEEVNKEFFGEFFNENSVDYLSKSAGSRWFRDLLLMILDPISPDQVKSVADIGCGIGHKTSVLKSYFRDASVSGFDFSESAIAVAKKHFGPSGIAFSCDDITAAKNNSRYDLIAAFDVLEHVDDWKSLTKQLSEQNNRYFIISVPVGRMRPYEVHIGHFRNFQTGEIEAYMSELGYATVKTFYAGFPFYSPILRDLTNYFFKSYAKTSQARMSKVAQLGHNVWYVLFRYFSMKQKGDVFIGLFDKGSVSQPKTV